MKHTGRTRGAPGWPQAAIAVAALTLGAAAGGCVRHKVDPIQVEPIHITLDVNLRVDRQLEEFFDFEDEIERQLATGEDAGSTEGER